MDEATLEAGGQPSVTERAGRFFAGLPRLEGGERTALLARLAELDERLSAAGLCRSPGWRARGAAALAPAGGVSAGLLRRRWLDLSADLAEEADALGEIGLEREALAMEDVAGRLLEVLLGGARTARQVPIGR